MNRNRRGFSPRFCIFPGYNWCGPGCHGPGPPINAVDAVCKAHDLCYDQYGPSCGCDREFLDRLSHLMNPHTEEGRRARLMYNYMKMQTFFTCGFY
ncbi:MULTISPECIES: phospholipase [Allobacillus]|uniref:Phospholipase n=1 Tax=Allobacillus salarius TaxID=1955272 RepID=A0A556P9Z4_9BACI|nr:phospholipase [Allobacillus salarius]TSJ61219.1 phospholipase [Allobacillus salarius]